MDQHGDFSRGSVKGHIFQQAWPMIIAQLVGVLYSVADRMFIGHMPDVGSEALTGIGILFPVITLVNAFANWGGQGGAALFAMARGRGDEKRAMKIMGNTCLLFIVFTFILCGLGYGLESSLLRAFGGSDETIPYASDYLRIYLAGTFFQLISLGLNPYFGASGFPRQGMLAVIIGAGFNLALDPVFIFSWHMGIRGAAYATLLSQFLSAAWTLCFLSSKKRRYRLSWVSLRYDASCVREILYLGFANFLFQLTNALTQAVSNKVLYAWGGDLQVAIMTVVQTLRQIFCMPLNGLTNAAKPVLSYNYGAKRGDRVVEGIAIMTRCGLWTTGIVSAIALIFPRQLIALFTTDTQVILEGATPMRIFFLFFLFFSFQISGQSTFTALGFAKEATFFSLLRKVFLILPLTLILPYFMGARGVFTAEAVSQIVGGSACYLTMYRRVYCRLKNGLEVRD